MWCRRQRWEALVEKAAQLALLESRVRELERQVTIERERAENAIDDLLRQVGAAPIKLPPEPEPPAPPLFDDDPAELAAMLKRMQEDPVGTLMETVQ